MSGADGRREDHARMIAASVNPYQQLRQQKQTRSQNHPRHRNRMAVRTSEEIELNQLMPFSFLAKRLIRGGGEIDCMASARGFRNAMQNIIAIERKSVRLISVCQVRTKKILNVFRRKAPDSAIWSSFLICVQF